jgi:hypothetical protein
MESAEMTLIAPQTSGFQGESNFESHPEIHPEIPLRIPP